jgi:hypothetical protein
MSTKKINSVNLLPESLRTEKNSKFLSSTIDQLINPADLERIDGYVGSTITPNYVSTSDIYISETSSLRRDYQLEPALIVNDSLGNINDVIGLDDLVNEISLKGGEVSNLDRLFRSTFYSYDPCIDWDKFVNYQNYYWLVNGPAMLTIHGNELDISEVIIGKPSYTYEFTFGDEPKSISLADGMLVRFQGDVYPSEYQNRDFFVEGVGTAIKLISYTALSSPGTLSETFIEQFDANPFDSYPFDGNKKLSIDPEYVTINRASIDLNSWSRYNRWVHKNVIQLMANLAGDQAVYPSDQRARRPIVEFREDLKLYNFGTIGIPNIDLIDTDTLDAFDTVQGSSGYYVDRVLLQQGNTVIFAADTDPVVRGKIYRVNFKNINKKIKLVLEEIISTAIGSVTSINFGSSHVGTSWWYDGNTWQYAQQRTSLNQPPLFDLFDYQGRSYSDKNYYKTNFDGNKIFGYDVGTIYDSVLGIKLKYRSSYEVGNYLFKNYFMTDSFSNSINSQTTEIISTSGTYFKSGEQYINIWRTTDPYPMPLLTAPISGSTYYEPPLGLTNNPLNGPISSLTLSEMSDHIIHSKRRLISNKNPLSFAQFFIGKKEHNVVDALSLAASQYNEFKLSFLKKIEQLSIQRDPVAAVDQALKEINADKDLLSPYYLSDMVAYGTNKITRTWTVTNSRNKTYAITTDYNPRVLSVRSVLVYVNGNQLIRDQDYVFEVLDSSVTFLIDLVVGDVIVINDYTDTRGSFVPSTPSKLGLYYKYTPKIFNDKTYVDQGTMVIQGHDGSIMLAYNDYRDDIILELEKRIFNNIKAEYNSDLFDINSVIPGAFRSTAYSTTEINNIAQGEFNNWAGIYGIDITANNTFDQDNSWTWNYSAAYNRNLQINLQGSWRAVYRYFYDTDRPHTHPWEMLGITVKPEWWDNLYGPAPYTNGNLILWEDIEAGRINGTVDSLYARPGLSNVIPVNENGDLLNPTDLIVQVDSITSSKIRHSWNFGDLGPAEYSWRRSSYWPFVVQKILALTKPADYAALMYDPIRLTKNLTGQWTYDSDHKFLNPKLVKIHGNGNDLTSGYSVYVVEAGSLRAGGYLEQLKTDLQYINYNLFYKVGGFISKDKMQIIIDAIDPTSTSPGAILPQEDYHLILNTSNPVNSFAMSGVIIQKSNGKFILRGYDNRQPYFSVYSPIRNINTPAITVGGRSESYVVWAASQTGGSTGLTDAELTTANSAVYGTYYQQGQVVSYKDRYYRVKISHRSANTFNPDYFQVLISLPIVGGVAVQDCDSFNNQVVNIPYGTEFGRIQEVYDVLVGYGAWLEDNGFIFDQFNDSLQSVLDWKFSGREFLYWTTQNWADNSVITLSPFADQIKFTSASSVVDNLFDTFNNYRLLQVNGRPLDQRYINVNREDNVCTIGTQNTSQGIYFAVLNLIQKEHAMVFNNTTMFNDIIYDIETGYRQRRMKLLGFRTAGWNGDYFSPGFVYDQAQVSDWSTYTDYRYADVVRFNGTYYSANKNIPGATKFDFTKWTPLRSKPSADLVPNFDYKISQFEDFYSLDIDNFDSAQQQMAQHLIGYTPRVYLNNIFTNPVSQYKFYQGYIKEKGTRNSINKLAKASIQNHQGEINFTEEWAFRIGHYGSYETFKELEISLIEGSFIENPQIINFVDSIPKISNNLIVYSTASDRVITPTNYSTTETFVVTNDKDIFQIDPAGYVNINDADYTVYNENILLNIKNDGAMLLKDQVVWLATKPNGDWVVYRYALSRARIVKVILNSDVVDQLVLTTNIAHNLQIGDVVSIDRFDEQINGIYLIKSIVSETSFSIKLSTSLTSLTPNSYGLLYKFMSVRYDSFDQLPNDKDLLFWPENSKIWIDDTGTEKWAVYKKIKNYQTNSILGPDGVPNQKLGWSVSKNKNSNVFMIGSPGYPTAVDVGGVTVYEEVPNGAMIKFRYQINQGSNVYHSSSSEFGYSVVYDTREFHNQAGPTGYGLFIAGAPGAGRIKSSMSAGSIRYASLTGYQSSNDQEGLVKISSVDPISQEEVTERVLLSPAPRSHERFGSSLYLQSMSTASNKKLLVGAPHKSNVGTGTVYVYEISTGTAEVNLTLVKTLNTSSINKIGSLWGNTISGSDDAGIIAISAPGYFTNTGLICIFTGTDLTYSQTIVSPFGKYGQFGHAVKISDNGNYLFVSAPEIRESDQSYGKVAIYTLTNNLFVLDSVVANPLSGAGMRFGQAIDINQTDTELLISAIGTNRNIRTTFDKSTSVTVFDGDSTTFYDSIAESGTVYVYNRKNNKFKLADDLTPVWPYTGTNFGYSLAINDNSIYVGAPCYSNSEKSGALHQFYKKDIAEESWSTLRSQDPLVDLNTVQKIALIDTFNDEIVEYLDTIDPLKGKIAGIVDQDIKYRSAFDPAIYTQGNSDIVVDPEINWVDMHVGELWWDLSTTKYMWYEQGDLVYRKNNWGKLFPGSSVDVYEWVGTPYLPSQWSEIADTSAGLTMGISGQPKYPDDNVFSTRKIYNSVSDSFENYYYYWVKNKTTVPNTKNRRISAFEAASIIKDPSAYGVKYSAIIDKDALLLFNVSDTLVDNRIHLNVNSDIINNPIPRHTEWLLLQEGSANSRPNTLLEKKLIDSLLGHDSLGNPVPDPALSSRAKYGIEIRPRQTLFKDRLEALRNIVEFSNSVLINNRITGNYNFTNLKKKEEIPNFYTREYDQIVEDNDSLLAIDLTILNRAQLSCEIENGRVVNVNIDVPGYGYRTSPTVSTSNPTVSISTEIDEFGQIVDIKIDKSGEGLSMIPSLEVRPYTVIVRADSENNGKWSKFIYNQSSKTWVRLHTQKYNTELYWEYQDWVSDSYNKFLDYAYTINEVYELNLLTDLQLGDYVKIRNGGLGYYMIVRKTAPGETGSFDNNFDLVYYENGTIRILDTIWNQKNSKLNYDYIDGYDQTLYDQTPDLELQYILLALKEDLFINELKINWNLLFFTAVKYATSEQKMLDWAFKTSFINVTNYAGGLDQRPVYKLQNAQYFEDYIKEVKPYHTKIRSFTENYSVLDASRSYTTDFDLPAYYNSTDNKFETVDINNDLTNVYPWKSWKDNRLTTGTVRTNLIGIKFDRTSRSSEITNLYQTDNFLCNGYDNEFVLTWVPEPEKSKITITLNGALVLNADYAVINYDIDRGEYKKQCSKIRFLNYTPILNQILKVSYTKKISLLNAVDRTLNYYTATSGMPGLDLGQLISGIVYPKTRVESLKFNYTTNWDIESFADSAWNDDISYYTSTTTNAVSLSIGGTWTSIGLNGTRGISKGQYVNVISTLTNAFTTSTVSVVSINTVTNVVVVNAATVRTIPIGSTVEFWTLDSNAFALDSAIDGGTWTNSIRVGALGINPEDITIDGDGFITADTSHAPEELVPGEINESIGINVYTKNPQGAPLVLSSYVLVTANSTTTQQLSMIPPSANSIIVSFNGNILTYNTSTNWITPAEYTINWATNSIVVPPQPVNGQLGYMIVGIGGGRPDKESGVIDSSSISITGSTSTQVQSLASRLTVKSAYVTVNGLPITTDSSKAPYYELTYVNSGNRRAAVNVYGLSSSAENTIIAWFFGNYNKYFNEIREQKISITSSSAANFVLLYPPGNIEPVVEQAIVELYDPATGRRKILRPPHADYYRVENRFQTFTINNSGSYTTNDERIRVYLNGKELRRGFEYYISGNQVTITVDSFKINDVVAIVSKPNISDYDYDIILHPTPVVMLNPGFVPGTELRVITYTDHDAMLIRTERFPGVAGRRYKISRPVLDTNYLWVIVNGIPLINQLDYEVLDDRVTVQISSKFEHYPNDNITIISISDSPLATTVLGYRMFSDIFNRTHFKRLSKQNTTYLTRELNFTDTEIHVADSSVLTPPLAAKNIPGVIIVDGERIEFFTVNGNVLGQLRRSTLGTAPSFYSEEHTKVIDQSPEQTIPTKETVLVQTQLTSTLTNTYFISSSTGILNTGTYHQFNNSGITLSADYAAVDQIDVIYGGRRLRKAGIFHQDITAAYDSPQFVLNGSVASVDQLPVTTVLGEGYIITATNQVWVYENSRELDSVAGYVYHGLNYVPAEFSVTLSNLPNVSAELVLNIQEGLKPGVKLTVIKREAAVWNDVINKAQTRSLMDSTTSPARFIQARPAELPDKYYYGGDVALVDDAGYSITTNDNQPLEDF